MRNKLAVGQVRLLRYGIREIVELGGHHVAFLVGMLDVVPANDDTMAGT